MTAVGEACRPSEREALPGKRSVFESEARLTAEYEQRCSLASGARAAYLAAVLGKEEQ